MSDIQDYIRYIIEKHETFPTNPPVNIYIKRFNLELQTPSTMKLFGNTKKLIEKTKNLKKLPSIEVVQVGLIQCNLVDN